MRLRQAVGLVALAAFVFSLVACGSAEQEQTPGNRTGTSDDPVVGVADGGMASCVLMVTYEGHAYEALGVEIAPVEGDALEGAIIPPCNDTGPLTEPEEAEHVAIAELPGVSPSVAVLLQGRGDVVLVRNDVDHDALPDAVTRLLRAPRCDARDEPIQLAGPWLGILGADDSTEDDLEPPYDVEMSVEESSAPRYERAQLKIRVPSSLERPLTRQNVEASLWEGGSIAVTAGCDGGRFVAQSLEAHPPA